MDESELSRVTTELERALWSEGECSERLVSTQLRLEGLHEDLATLRLAVERLREALKAIQETAMSEWSATKACNVCIGIARDALAATAVGGEG